MASHRGYTGGDCTPKEMPGCGEESILSNRFPKHPGREAEDILLAWRNKKKFSVSEEFFMETHPIRRWTCLLVFALGLAVSVEPVEAGGSGEAPAREQMDAYRELLVRTVDEASLDLPYGALKEKTLGREEMAKRRSMTAGKIMGAAQSGDFRTVLEQFDALYGTITQRLLLQAEGELQRYPTALLAWHLKLAMGFKDCQRVTADALAEVVRSGQKDLVLTDPIRRAVGMNAGYFRILRWDLEGLLRTVPMDETEIRNYADRLHPLTMYIENTWK